MLKSSLFGKKFLILARYFIYPNHEYKSFLYLSVLPLFLAAALGAESDPNCLCGYELDLGEYGRIQGRQ